MARTRRRKRARQAAADRLRPAPEPRLPSELEIQLGDTGLELARRELKARKWQSALRYAATARASDPVANAVVAEASAREARRAALCGRFAEAESHAERALALRPAHGPYQERRRLLRLACGAVLRDRGEPLFPDTLGPSRGHWWEHDLLARVRGWDGTRATVDAPLILEETRRRVLDGVYAVGTYQPWHVPGADPLFTRYLRALKPGGKTIPYAAILLRQGLTEETDWIEDVDVIVPMATSLRSHEQRQFELTEDLAAELGLRLCLPVVDAFEVDPEAEPTHHRGGYVERARALADSLRVKAHSSALLREAEAVLVLDDVVTYGATLEACAMRLREYYPHLRVFGATLAYTETPQRRARAAEEQAEMREFGDGG